MAFTRKQMEDAQNSGLYSGNPERAKQEADYLTELLLKSYEQGDNGYVQNKFAYSPMDFLYSQSMHSPIFKGYIVGGDVGLGLGFFGYIFPLFQFLIYLLIFRYLDQIVMFNSQHAVIPTLTLISIYDYFFIFFVSTGVFERLVSFFWVIPVGLILKILMMKVVKKVFG